jgi:hypothetical protein
MPTKINKLAATAAVAAVLSMLATPAAAVELPRPATVDVYDSDALNAERNRRWRRDRNDIDTGDVIAGVVILGAIAAIAGAGKNRRERERERYEQPYPQQNDDYGYQGGYERSDGRGIDRAVDMCVGEVERGSDRVGSVDNASRSGEGWHVSGALENGEAYSCTIGNDGQIGDVTVGERSAYAQPEDGQWSDADYARARANQDYAEREIDPNYLEDAGDDQRYETARAPDFAQ